MKQKDFDEQLQKLVDAGNAHPEDADVTTEDDLPALRARRFMECICVKDGEKLHLLCDDSRSLMRTLYNEKLVLLRVYDCDVKNT